LSHEQTQGDFPLTEVPYQNTPGTKTRVKHAHYQDKMRDKFVKLRRINDAIAVIRRGEFTNYANTAREYKCDRGALSRRIRSLTKSKKDANSFWHQYLTIEQEEVLIYRINTLTNREMPPTSYIVRNLAEEIRGRPVGKN
jgi:hypothetical protein